MTGLLQIKINHALLLNGSNKGCMCGKLGDINKKTRFGEFLSMKLGKSSTLCHWEWVRYSVQIWRPCMSKFCFVGGLRFSAGVGKYFSLVVLVVCDTGRRHLCQCSVFDYSCQQQFVLRKLVHLQVLAINRSQISIRLIEIGWVSAIDSAMSAIIETPLTNVIQSL